MADDFSLPQPEPGTAATAGGSFGPAVALPPPQAGMDGTGGGSGGPPSQQQQQATQKELDKRKQLGSTVGAGISNAFSKVGSFDSQGNINNLNSQLFNAIYSNPATAQPITVAQTVTPIQDTQQRSVSSFLNAIQTRQ